MKLTTVKINVSKILKEHLYAGKNGKYLDLALIENRDGPDQYGNDGFVTQSVSKEARQRGEKGPIIGNFKRIDTDAGKQAQAKPASKIDPHPDDQPAEDDVPF